MDVNQYRRAAREYFRERALRGVFAPEERRVTLLARHVSETSSSSQNAATENKAENEEPLAGLLARSRLRMVITGRPGAGKTTALLSHALALSEAEAGPLPVFVFLRELDRDYQDLERLIEESMERVAPGASIADLRTGSWVLILDGINERDSAKKAIERLVANFPALPMIFSSRESASGLGETFEVLPLSQQERDQAIDSMIPVKAADLKERLTGDSSLDALSRTPLLLALLCDAVRDGITPRATRSALIRASIEKYATHFERKSGDEDVNPPDLERALAVLAFRMLERGDLGINLSEAKSLLGNNASLLSGLRKFHLLRGSGRGWLEFVHPLVTEFFAAQHLRARGLPSHRELLRVLCRTAWTEVFRLFAEECSDQKTANRLVDAAGEVDVILSGRIVGAFPPDLQPGLLARLVRLDEPVGTRMMRAFSVGTAAAAGELRHLAVHPDREVRFQIACELWDIFGPEITSINTLLLRDSWLPVVTAASHNLRRHSAPVADLLEALRRDDVLGEKYSNARPRLISALLRSDTEEAGRAAVELARTYLLSTPTEDCDSFGSIHSEVQLAFSDTLAPSVVRALHGLLGELDDSTVRILLAVLWKAGEVVDLAQVLPHLPSGSRREFLENCMSRLDRISISDEALLEVIQSEPVPWRDDPLLQEAIKRRCAGLCQWLFGLVAGDVELHGYVDVWAFRYLLALDPASAAQASERALASSHQGIRHRIARALLDERSPTELRARGLQVAYADVSLAEYVVRWRGPELVLRLVEDALQRRPREEQRRLIDAFYQRDEIVKLAADFAATSPRYRRREWPTTMDPALRRAFTRCVLASADSSRTEAFLRSEVWVADENQELVVDALSRIVEGSDGELIQWALQHLDKIRWRPSLETFVHVLRLVPEGVHLPLPGVTPEELFDALEPLLVRPEVRVRAFHHIGQVPGGRIDRFVALLEIPDLSRAVAARLIYAECFHVFPELLRRSGLIVPEREPISTSWSEVRMSPIPWSDFWRHFEGAPLEIRRECVEILATREDPAWDRAFLDAFRLAPSVKECTRLVAAWSRKNGAVADEQALRALVRAASSTEDFNLLELVLGEPSLPLLLIAKIYAEDASPAAAPSIRARLTRLIDGDPSVKDSLRPDLAVWWIRFLGRVGDSADAAYLLELAVRAQDVWVAQELHRQAAEIQRRTGFYSRRYSEKNRPWTLLHLSDLHFQREDEAERWFTSLAHDLRCGLELERLDAVVISGDIVDRANPIGYAAAVNFVERLRRDFRVDRGRVVIIPGNHDVDRKHAEPALRELETLPSTLTRDCFTAGGKHFAIVDRERYNARLAGFAGFFERALGRVFPLDPGASAHLWTWPELEVLVLGLSSVSELDGQRKDHAAIDSDVLARALQSMDRTTDHFLKIAVFHHPLNGPGDDRIREHEFLGHLAKAGFSLILHGHVHHDERELFHHEHRIGGRRLEVVGAGTFGARSDELPTGVSWQYNVIRFDGERARVETRCRRSQDASWGPHAFWPDGPREPPRAWYELDLGASGKLTHGS
jgi:hypothetical protein